MTNEVAIKILAENYPKKCKMVNGRLRGGFDDTDCALGQAFSKAIKALEKQIQKKPKMRHVKKYDGYNDGWCPSCGDYIQETDFDKKFCQDCGQKLDWSEEE